MNYLAICKEAIHVFAKIKNGNFNLGNGKHPGPLDCNLLLAAVRNFFATFCDDHILLIIDDSTLILINGSDQFCKNHDQMRPSITLIIDDHRPEDRFAERVRMNKHSGLFASRGGTLFLWGYENF